MSNKLPEEALSIFKDPAKGWCVAAIKYNPSTGEVGKVQVLYTFTDRVEAIEQFKIEAGNRNIVG